MQNQLSHIPGSLKIIIEEYVNNLKNASVGSKISLFSLRNQAGSTKNFNIFENNEYYSLISVWASWDSLSCEKMKDVVKLSKKFKDKPLRFVNISMDTNDSIWNEKIKELGLPDKNFILQRGFNSDVCNKIGIRTIPYNIVLNNKLIIEAKNIYGKELTELLDKKVPKQFPKKK